ncbi:N-acetylglucosamine kinase [Paenibacillus sp. YN15]|uniref:N-acetylglucosamine kinase n=1 Tax=Paenibacillus sp. YN15 TaxID=1742774 RepID=UPI000DCC9DCD|nr:BadF/BadG/BcrA/BcrD ATPase family protein [Paenibacillus sp. YN15]RAU97120.1 ATPase [Paenibacillus sp. YN15]
MRTNQENSRLGKNLLPGFVAGMDGGGTKTTVTVMDAQGNTVHEFTAGGINYNGRKETEVEQALHGICAELAANCGSLGQIRHMVIGAAGVSNPAIPGRLTAAVRSNGYEGPLRIIGDHEAALHGAFGGGPGLLLIAGTGSVSFGRNAAGETGRAGGFGHLIDDGGSAYSIGRGLLAAAVRAWDGREPPTVISRLLRERQQLSGPGEIVGFAYDPATGKKDIAALAPLLEEACMLGDQAALRLASESAAALVELVAALAARLAMRSGPLALSGSVLLRNPYVRAAFDRQLAEALPQMHIVPPRLHAAAGAAALALELAAGAARQG